MITAVVESIIQNDITYNKETGQLFWNKSGKGSKMLIFGPVFLTLDLPFN